MNIDIVCSSRELFGADRSALRLAEVLMRLGANPRLVVPSRRPERGLVEIAAERGLAAIDARVSIATARGIEDPFALAPRLDRNRPDLTIFNSSAVLGVSSSGRRRVTIIREWLEPKLFRHRALAFRHRVRADAVVGISHGVLRQWEACVRGPSRRAVIHNWLEVDDIERPESIGNDGSRSGILCLGRFNQWKGQEVLADAYEHAFPVPGDGPRMTFVGAQPGTEFQSRADSLTARGFEQGWRIEPFVNDPSPYLAEAALLVLPSLHPEPFGMVILEALAWGCRVLAFPGGGADDLGSAFPHAIQIVDRSTTALAGALSSWWTNGGRGQSRDESRTTYERLHRDWSSHAATERWRALLEDLA